MDGFRPSQPDAHQCTQTGQKSLLIAYNPGDTFTGKLKMQPTPPIPPCRCRTNSAKGLRIGSQLPFLCRQCLRPGTHALSHLLQYPGNTGILLRNQLASIFIFPLGLPALRQCIHTFIERKDKIRKSQALGGKMSREITGGYMSVAQQRSGNRIQCAQRCQLVPFPAGFPCTAPAANPVCRPVKYRP